MNATGILSNRFLHAYLRLPGKLRVPYHVHVQFSSFFMRVDVKGRYVVNQF